MRTPGPKPGQSFDPHKVAPAMVFRTEFEQPRYAAATTFTTTVRVHEGAAVRALVRRYRKTKRSAWTQYVWLCDQPNGTTADVRIYMNALLDFIDAIVWPEPGVTP